MHTHYSISLRAAEVRQRDKLAAAQRESFSRQARRAPTAAHAPATRRSPFWQLLRQPRPQAQ